MIDRKFLRVVFIFAAVLAVGGLAALPAHAQGGPTPPDLNVCNGVTCETLPDSVCSDAGFKITLTNFLPGNTQNSGTATYTYEICSPSAGVCGGDGTKSCLSNDDCTKGGNPQGVLAAASAPSIPSAA